MSKHSMFLFDMFFRLEEEIAKLQNACAGLSRLRLAHLPQLPSWAVSRFLHTPLLSLDLCTLDLR